MIGKLMTQEEIARRYAVVTKTIEHWRVIGWGPPFLKVGAKVFYREEDVIRYELDNLKTRNDSPTSYEID